VTVTRAQAADPKSKSGGQGSLPAVADRELREKLTPRQQKFVVLVADKGLKPVEAAVKAGFTGANVERQVRRLLATPHVTEALASEARRRLSVEAPRALHRMVDLSENARSQRVQFEATKDLLDRAGIGQTLGTASGSVRLTINLLAPTPDMAPSPQLIEGTVVGRGQEE